MSAVLLQDVRKAFVDRSESSRLIIDGFHLDIKEHEIVCLFGPNGAGKTTLIRICSGVLTPDRGSVQVFGAAAGASRIGYIPQAYGESLFPWLTNLDNIALPLRVEGRELDRARNEARSRIAELGLQLPLDSYPYQSSGGEKQLAALGRALMSSPKLLLADEPFSALDILNRRAIQDLFLSIVNEGLRITTLIVTHSLEDAIYIADRVVVVGPPLLSIRGTVPISLPRPRSQDMKQSVEFLALERRVLDFLVPRNSE